ncbi:monocarboxylate permease-like protein [Xylariaceae sp. FL0255]|nr:monocarboxylate permease-like protein [Xylariaceae sp. FL0255]
MLTWYRLFQTNYELNQLSDQSPYRIAWIVSSHSSLTFSASLVADPLFHRHGAKHILFPAAIVYVASVMLTSISSQYWHFILAQGVLGGSSSGMVLNPAFAAPPQYFFKKRGAAMGLVVAGSSIGIGVFPIALPRLFDIPTLHFGWGVRITGFIILALLTLSSILNGSSFFGRIALGILLDRLGRFNMFATASVISAILLFVWTRATTTGSIVAFAVIFGFFSGGISSCFSTSLASAASNLSNTGTYIGQGSAIGAVAILIGPPINGAFLTTYGQFNQLAIFNAVVCLLRTGLVLAAKCTTPAGIKGIV